MTLACQAQSPTQQPARETPASSTTPSAQSPTVGAWRKVSDAQFNQQYRFSMLPGGGAAAARLPGRQDRVLPGRRRAGDQRGRAGQQLRHSGPVDHRSGQRLEPDAAPYRPRVQLLRAEGALLDYEFSDMADELGGLLLPAQAVARTLELDGQRYSVTRGCAAGRATTAWCMPMRCVRPRVASPWRSRFPTGSIERDRGATCLRRWRQA